MLLQWKDELESRFGLGFVILDKAYVGQVRRERGFGINPWDTHTRFLVSQRLLIDEAYSNPLISWLGEFRPGALLILDEAHHAAPSSGQRYAIDSQTTRVIGDLAPRFEHRLFLSATPHNGHSNSFSALLEILDPQRFCRGVAVQKKQLEAVMVRRLKDDIREIAGGFPKRNVVPVEIDGLPDDAPELQLSKLLNQYRELRESRLASDTKRVQATSALLIVNLQQRLFSSIEAFARTLKVHRETARRQWENRKADTTPSDRGFQLLKEPIGADDDRATLEEEELQQEEESAVADATLAAAGEMTGKTIALFKQEQVILDEMSEIAEPARYEPDARIRALLDWMERSMCPGLASGSPTWNNTRVIIFTEYDDTKRYLRDQLRAAIGEDESDKRIAIFHGPTPPEQREVIKQAFNSNPAKNPVRILIATDAAREGLNLQAHCWNLFHFDVPWNPSRMEQRNGRIDRKLQPAKEVHCHYFYYKQRPEDRILKVLVKKTETIRRELGSLAQVIDARLHKLMQSGIRRDQIEPMAKSIEDADIDPEKRKVAEEELEDVRQRRQSMKEDLEKLQADIERSQKSIGFDRESLISAISCSLKLVGAPPLKRLPGPVEAYEFPRLDQREGADPTWAVTMDTLRALRAPDQKFFEWRRQSPVRPVVFEDQGTMDDTTVHLHLEQRAVQRLLSRFSAQGFVYHELSRACLTQSKDGVPRVALLGRLCLYGEGAARLHEELIPITARWAEPSSRKQPLSPYSRDAESLTMELLDDALRNKSDQPQDKAAIKLLQSSAAKDIEELLPHLTARGEDFAKEAQKRLKERGAAEANAMQEVLKLQKKRIADTAKKFESSDQKQLLLKFTDDEERQVQANKRHWAKRLENIYAELETEPARIRAVYDVKAKRIEPIGLVYLWPAR